MSDQTVPLEEIQDQAVHDVLAATADAHTCQSCGADLTLDPGPDGMWVRVVHDPRCTWMAAAAMTPVCPPVVVVAHTIRGDDATTSSASPDGSLEGTPFALATGVPGGPAGRTPPAQPPGPAGPAPTRRNDAARTDGDRVEPRPDRADRSEGPAEAVEPDTERREAVGGLTN